MEALDFGPYQSLLGTPKKDTPRVEGATGFYAGAGKDILTNGSFQIESETAPGGFQTVASVLSGGSGNDKYDFLTDQEWGFVADAGGGKDTIQFSKSSVLNPKNEYVDSAISTILINDRDVMLATTNFETGARELGIVLSDPFGTLAPPENKLENIKFGKKKTRSRSSTGVCRTAKKLPDFYPFDTATFPDLGDAGVLNLTEFPDTNVLKSGDYIQITVMNNSMVA